MSRSGYQKTRNRKNAPVFYIKFIRTHIKVYVRWKIRLIRSHCIPLSSHQQSSQHTTTMNDECHIETKNSTWKYSSIDSTACNVKYEFPYYLFKPSTLEISECCVLPPAVRFQTRYTTSSDRQPNRQAIAKRDLRTGDTVLRNASLACSLHHSRPASADDQGWSRAFDRNEGTHSQREIIVCSSFSRIWSSRAVCVL